jgi:MOSC domain-containing protein YiiM
MLHPSSTLTRLFNAPVRPGRITWLGVRPLRREPMQPRDEVLAEARRGLIGDRYSRLDGGRQVTLIEDESLSAIAGYLGVARVSPEATRRNLVTRGINLLALKGQRFRIGEAILETSGECHPCSRMEEILGVGGYNAMRGRGGITARVVAGGVIRRDDLVERLDAAAASVGSA